MEDAAAGAQVWCDVGVGGIFRAETGVALTAAGDDAGDQGVEPEQRGERGAIGGRHELNRFDGEG